MTTTAEVACFRCGGDGKDPEGMTCQRCWGTMREPDPEGAAREPAPPPAASPGETEFITIGYGDRKPSELVELCWGEGVVTVVDVRLRPDRAWSGVFARTRDPQKGIEGLFAEAKIGYVSLPELGNVFFQYPDWVDRYTRLLDRAGDLLVDRLDEISGPLALLCAERRVGACHRGSIAEFLVTRAQRLPSARGYRLLGHIE